jgi:hypothetical protein
METTETSLLILNVGVRFEHMGNAGVATPPVEILFRNMTSSAIVGETRKFL